MNLPNWITVARIAMVPVFFGLSYGDTDGAAIGAFTIFLVASLSDYVDGYLARRDGLESRLGAFLDPLADKLLIGAALVVLVDTRAFPLWAALVIAVREVAVQILRTTIVRGGGSLPASVAAKWKTSLQIWMVSWWLLPWDTENLVHWIFLGVVVVSTVLSGAEYFIKAQRAAEKPKGVPH